MISSLIEGFDAVEIHVAHGYMTDQFIKDSVNDQRTRTAAA